VRFGQQLTEKMITSLLIAIATLGFCVAVIIFSIKIYKENSAMGKRIKKNK